MRPKCFAYNQLNNDIVDLSVTPSGPQCWVLISIDYLADLWVKGEGQGRGLKDMASNSSKCVCSPDIDRAA